MNAPARSAESSALTTTTERPPYELAQRAPTGRDLILNAGNFAAVTAVAKMMANAKQAVAKCLRGNEGACMAVAMQAMRWNMDPFALATKVYTTDADGPISYEGQAIIAALNNSPLLATRLAFRWEGAWEKIIGKFEWRESKQKKDEHGNAKKYLAPTWGDKDEDGLCVIVSATLVGESQPRELQLFMKQARVRNSPLWTEDPRQQLAYLGGRRWGRIYAPDVIMGVYSPDELMEFDVKDMGLADVVQPDVPPELVERAKKAAAAGLAAYQTFWRNTTMMEKALLSESSAVHEECKIAAAEADKKRTVDTPTSKGAGAPAAAPKPATAASQADPGTGETTPPAGAAATTSTTVDRSDSQEAFVANFATVLDLLVKAKAQSRLAVEIAAEWIDQVPNEEHRKELERKRDEIFAELDAPQGAAK